VGTKITAELSLNEYQEKVQSTAVYPGQGSVKGVEYCLFGALGELGEIANKYKKILRKEENVYKHREDLMEEIGDVLWYTMQLLKELGYTAEYAAQHNISKLQVRKAEGTLKERESISVRSCNRHSNCDKAETEVLARNPGKTRSDINVNFHCHDEECEDCFGS
jgi:NTP pyrophosphatase (non-canonical NTP hydrolase)